MSQQQNGGGTADEYLNLVEASRYLGISRATFYKLIREDRLPTFQSEVNRAVRLVRCADLDRLRQPRPIKSVVKKK